MIIKEAINESSFFGGFLFYTYVTLLFLIFGEYIFVKKLIIAFVASLAIVSIIKLIKFTERPQKQKFYDLIHRIEASSFPSMHSTRSMLLALLIGSFFNNIYIYLLAIFIALFTGFSRIYQRRHYLIDTIIGYILGTILFYLLNSIV